MKDINKFFLLWAFLIFTLIAKTLYESNSSISVFHAWIPLSRKIIVIDPGHGGIDGGTNYKQILEKDINLDVSLKLKRSLEKEGANVIMTRTEDIALDELNTKSEYRHIRDLIARQDIINNVSPDLFISIHVNAEKGSQRTSGPMVFYYNNSEVSRKVAVFLQRRLEEAYINSGYDVARRKPVPNTTLFLLKNTKYPGVIVELGFMTNPRDRSILINEDFQKSLSQAIILALKDYFKKCL